MVNGSWPAAVVFDFDGLLMDTESTSFESWRHEWEQWGLALDPATFFAEHGGDITEQRYAELAAAVGLAFDKDLSHSRRIAYRDGLHAGLDLLPGMRDWLREAGQAGTRLAIASSSPRRWVTGHLGRVGARPEFEVLACGDEVAAAKPAPDVYLLALDRLGLAGAEAVAVEDSAHGVAAAKTAGMRCIAIPNRFSPASRFAAADLVLDSAGQVSLSQALQGLPAARTEGQPPAGRQTPSR
ncbi:MAG TPA: HAD-IA family hydrolase [Streptosporangiaceae bacterium]|jgi:putative hydrolase of the HAD superfamily